VLRAITVAANPRGPHRVILPHRVEPAAVAARGHPLTEPAPARENRGSGQFIPGRPSPLRLDRPTDDSTPPTPDSTKDRLPMSLPSATDATHDDPPATLSLTRRFAGPDPLGRVGSFGGRVVPETLTDALNQLAEAYEQARSDPQFQARLTDYLTHYVGRPSPLFHARRLTEFAGGAEIYLKREDLNHTGAHKINNAIGQVML